MSDFIWGEMGIQDATITDGDDAMGVAGNAGGMGDYHDGHATGMEILKNLHYFTGRVGVQCPRRFVSQEE